MYLWFNNFRNNYFSDIIIRRNRKLVDYLKVLFNPKMYKEYILITQNNFILFDDKEFDKLFDTILVSIPIHIKG